MLFASAMMDRKRWDVRKWFDVMVKTMDQVFPLLATVISVGALVNIMTATGVRGLLAITFITLPMVSSTLPRCFCTFRLLSAQLRKCNYPRYANLPIQFGWTECHSYCCCPQSPFPIGRLSASIENSGKAYC